jgi:UDP-N-acetyl-2-amino-2-deoxyglucuronate dehydrogenase
MAAIKSIGGRLVAAFDPHDSVGVLDKHFPECRFFSEFERFDRYCNKLSSRGEPIDFVAIASPNYLHDAHCLWAMRIGADAICEKPLVLNERNLDELARGEQATGRRVWAILQLRHHPAAVAFKKGATGDEYVAKIRYHTPRGAWYRHSWKGDEKKSGGVATNIGIHLFDLCTWFFGENISAWVDRATEIEIVGGASFEKGGVWFNLSIDPEVKPARVFEIDGGELDLSTGFDALHSIAYREIVSGSGFGIEAARPGIRLVERIRKQAGYTVMIADLMAQRALDRLARKTAGPFYG